ncbi:MBL fold metallo-hydrolase [Tepidibacter aestuarii]|uniref:MBL fold metallo-hydrolase n=1 Tax=Tepidibacter aestuarii TaxID=2925782 RepID=UPI0020C04A4E|nr:MBL fold metallo-hydrolase [Tepidibacter aestuarii]CAH2213647.1 Glyoxylase, Hydroxyacylglutathione hydrolase GloC [Tepidibacter aestuarii]CAH2215653.1 Glyoxylase, Hydroxyacylglutathione hydrolase GloC [Tepidibacter aestuarii]
MILKRFVVGKISTNAYIIHDKHTLDAAVIDPGDNSKILIDYINRNNLKLNHIILTHHHYDHIGAVKDLKKQYNSDVLIHKKDLKGLKNPSINLSKKANTKQISIDADKILSNGSVINIGNIPLEVIHTPGHTKGGISLKAEHQNTIFTGDTLFNDGIGRLDLPGGSEEDMINTIKNIVSKWDDSIIIYPGHGNWDTMKNIRARNEEYKYIINLC